MGQGVANHVLTPHPFQELLPARSDPFEARKTHILQCACCCMGILRPHSAGRLSPDHHSHMQADLSLALSSVALPGQCAKRKQMPGQAAPGSACSHPVLMHPGAGETPCMYCCNSGPVICSEMSPSKQPTSLGPHPQATSTCGSPERVSDGPVGCCKGGTCTGCVDCAVPAAPQVDCGHSGQQAAPVQRIECCPAASPLAGSKCPGLHRAGAFSQHSSPPGEQAAAG